MNSIRRDPIVVPHLQRPIDVEVTLPGSKSITNRALLVAALADGKSRLDEALFSEDTVIFSESLQKLGIAVVAQPDAPAFEITGGGGRIPAKEASLWVGNAGTAARFLTAFTLFGAGRFSIDGVPAMRQRPMSDLLDVLSGLGAEVTFQGTPGHVPFTIKGTGRLRGGTIELAADRTSQQVTGLLLIAPYADDDVTIRIVGNVVSPSYLEMTCQLMRAWGVEVERPDSRTFIVRRGQHYQARRYAIEPDASSASYFFAAAAVSGGRVRVRHLSSRSLQGDLKFVDVLASMGCEVVKGDDFVELRRTGPLRGVEVDMNDISDTAPTLAAVAPFASGPVSIRNVEHMRWKETDRVHAVVSELRRMNITVDEHKDGLTVHPGRPAPALIQTYKDHRIAMAFSITGLGAPGITIDDPGCVAKTFPTFFERLFAAVGQSAGR